MRSLASPATRPRALGGAAPRRAAGALPALAPAAGRRAGRAVPRHVARRAARQDGSNERPRPDTPAPSAAASLDEAAGSGGGGAAVAAKAAPNLYLEPLARNFILGVGAGICFEAIHVTSKLLSSGGLGGAAELLAAGGSQLRPLFLADHAVAIIAWLALYALEAAAITAVVNRHGHDARAAAADVRSLPTLPKRLFPQRLNALKARLYAAARAFAPALAATRFPLTAAPPAAATAATPLTPSAASLSLDGGAGPLAAGGAGAALAERPAAAPRPKEGQQQQKAEEEEGGADDGPPPAPLGRSLERVLEGIAALPRTKERETAPAPAPAPGDEDSAPPLGRRDAELLERRSYLKNFWYAAALSSNLKAGSPLGVDILGSRVVLFRDEETGEISCLDDACPHRGAPLSGGWLQPHEPTGSVAGGPAPPAPAQGGKKDGKTCVVCPYHGWVFDGDGRLRDVPSAEPGAWPRRPLVGSYAVEERGGFVWLFYGDAAMPPEERPPIPCAPELEDPGWRAVYGEIEFDCGHWGVFDNAIDMAHIHYLHNDSFGNRDKPRILDMETSRDAFSASSSFRIYNKPPSKLWEWSAVPSVPVTAKAMLPSTSAVTIELAYGVKMITFVNTVPISADRAVNRFCLIRNFATSPILDGFARKSMFKILGEDKVMVDRLRPEATPTEVSLAPDGPQLAFRRLRAEWAALGYLVAPEEPGAPRRGLLPKDAASGGGKAGGGGCGGGGKRSAR
ncbi:MAG: hypothetical protein J3K34DRAFT_513670 [Monoraphidium minutum]|nr:MAG: hypothetical protein J3K34DRAFT_513670 [Monoraphidium minutum]